MAICDGAAKYVDSNIDSRGDKDGTADNTEKCSKVQPVASKHICVIIGMKLWKTSRHIHSRAPSACISLIVAFGRFLSLTRRYACWVDAKHDF